jgi:cobalt-zinc-cadmium resistance protein CzcA
MTTDRVARAVRGAAAQPGLAAVLALAGAVLGALGLRDLPRDVFPDLAIPVFTVIAQNTTMAPEELEAAVAIPLEAALAGLPAIRRVRSASQPGVVQVTAEFEADADYFRSRQLVAERVSQVAPSLPAGTEPPLVSSLTGRLNEIFEVTLEAEADAIDLMTLRDLAEFEVTNRLLAVPGVAAVDRLGGYLRQFQVQLDPDRMAARGVTLDEVLHAAEGASVDAAGGVVVQGATEWLVRGVGRVRTPAELRETVVAVRGATPVLLGDVADVRSAPAVRRGIAHRLAGEVVACRIVKQFGADTVAVAAGVRAALDDLRRTLPPGVQVRVVYDQSALVQRALGGVGRAVLLGAALVVIALVALLGDLRAALVVTATIPLSVGLAGLVLPLAGIGLNTMTLGGLAIAVALLVDAAIIVTENVVHRAAEGRGDAVAAAAEVGRPIVFATLIVVVVFLPLFALEGIEGRMYRPLAAAVVAAVSASLLLALTLVPALAGRIVVRPGRAAPGDGRLVRRVKAWYAPALDACLRHGGAVRLGALALTVPALALALRVGADLMPGLDEGALLIQTMLPPEASLEQVDRSNHRVEDVLREFPEVEDVVRRTGRAERTEDPMPHTLSDTLVILRGGRGGLREDLRERMRARLERVPGVSFLFTTPLGMRIDEGLGGTPADVSVRIFGPDLDELGRLAGRVQELVRGVDGIADVRAEPLTGLPQLRVAVDRAAAARAGLTPGDVLRSLRIALAGEEAAEVWDGQRRFALVVRLQDHRRGDLAAVRSVLVDGHDGTRFPLGKLARIEETLGPAVVRREAGSRRIAVDASVAGGDLAGAAERVRARLARDLVLPTGYFLHVGGRVETQARATRALVLAVVVAVLGVAVLLYLALGSLAEAGVILATLPDAFVGAILALLLTGETWNVSSLVGLIGLFGIAVQNGLVLVTQTRALVAEGRPFEAALREASLGRVRPKLMTAATAVLGLLPLLVLRLDGTEIERPLAVVMIGGLVTSTLFTLLALPAFYAFVHQLRR